MREEGNGQLCAPVRSGPTVAVACVLCRSSTHGFSEKTRTGHKVYSSIFDIFECVCVLFIVSVQLSGVVEVAASSSKYVRSGRKFKINVCFG